METKSKRITDTHYATLKNGLHVREVEALEAIAKALGVLATKAEPGWDKSK